LQKSSYLWWDTRLFQDTSRVDPTMDANQAIVAAHGNEAGGNQDEIAMTIPDPQASSSLNQMPLTCTWSGCESRSFRRKSDFKKHWDKHTKPYSCTEPLCDRINFGDKAGLQRHERERHGKHGAPRYFCQVETCSRHLKGFPRRKNRDVHVRTCHNIASEPRTADSDERGMEEASPTPSDQMGLLEITVPAQDERQSYQKELILERSKVEKLEAKIKKLESLLAMYIK